MKLLMDAVRRFDALAPRERLLIFAAVATLIAGVAFALIIDPALTRTKAARNAIAEREGQLSMLKAMHAELSARMSQDVNEPVRAELGQAQADLAAAESDIKAFHRTLIPADAMGQVLNGLLQRDGGVRLVSLRNLAPEPLMADAVATAREDGGAVKEADAAKGRPLLYRHGIELVVEGDYFDLLKYLTVLEKQEWRILWSDTRLSARYPVSRLELKVFTLSLDESWLSV